MQPRSVLILWSIPTSYFISSIRELANQLNEFSEITVVSFPADEWYPELLTSYNLPLVNFINYSEFNPRDYLNCDLILMTSWNYRKYRRVAGLNRRSCRIMTMDNQFLGTKKQKAFLASKVGPRYIRFLANFVFAGGVRQSAYAAQIGFQSEQILTGAFSFDDRIFRSEKSRNQKHQFCFVGRKVSVKGLDVLLNAYQDYQTLCEKKGIQPWDLVIAGPGRISRLVPKGVQELDYLSPSEVAALMSTSCCFVLPSTYEPFGVVLTEAAASGCLLIASSAVGAADDLVRENVNGFTYPQNSIKGLSISLLRISQFSAREIENGRKESINRAQKLAPKVWADKVLATYSTHSNSTR